MNLEDLMTSRPVRTFKEAVRGINNGRKDDRLRRRRGWRVADRFISKFISTGSPPRRRATSIKNLDPDICKKLLESLPDLQTLSALVHASRQFHKAYVADRTRILVSVLTRDLDPETLADALATNEVRTLRRHARLRLHRFEPDHADLAYEFIAKCEARRDSRSGEISGLRSKDLIQLARDQTTIHFLTEDFCRVMLTTHPTTLRPERKYEPPSKSERRRIHRVFWRLELFCHLFRPGERHHGRWFSPMRRIDAEERAVMFLARFPAWEVEELACVVKYVLDRYEGACREAGINKTQWIDAYSRDEPASGLEEYRRMEHCLEHLLSNGIGYLHGLLRRKPRDRRASLRWHAFDQPDFLSATLAADPQPHFSRTQPDRYHAWATQQPQPFEGDDHGPNAAWTWFNGGLAQCFYNSPLRAYHRAWAYVMWDRERLRQWRVFEFAPHHWDLVGAVDTFDRIRAGKYPITKRESDVCSVSGSLKERVEEEFGVDDDDGFLFEKDGFNAKQ